ncbi:MAG: hypothetical protein CVU89_14180 [Firmicutes bacterium HGW-Firmicutes-14]|nr:MAG: hypothetical protein CVU89_14180 [Firmicutes bacterium HGW-Firmicutes-14]
MKIINMGKSYKKRLRRWLPAIMAIAACLIIPAVAFGWPSNHVDSSATGDLPYCTSCHTYEAGYLTIESINGKAPRSNSVTITQTGTFDMTFRTVGLGYGRFTVAGSIQVPDTSKWALSQTGGGDTPWFIAQQSTIYGAPAESPYMWSTAFPAVDNPNSQKGVTIDDGSSSGAYIDRNLTAHDEQFTVHVDVYDQLPLGTYTLKIWGVGTSSAGKLSYNEQILSVNVTNDTTKPDTPTGLSASPASASSIGLSWNASSDPEPNSTGIDGYEVYRAPDESGSPGAYEYVGYTSSASYTDDELKSGTKYHYIITAVDNAGNISDYSAPASATTGTGAREDGAPSAPTGVKAFMVDQENGSNKVVRIQWNNNTEGDIVGYKVYRATELAGSYALITQSLVTTMTAVEINASPRVVVNSVYYVDTVFKYGTTYYYKVVAVDVDGKASVMSSYTAITPAVDQGAVNPHGGYDDPANAGLCGNCHSTHSARGSELIYYSSITDSCYTCHDGSQSKYNTKAAFDPVSNPSHHKVPEGRYSCDVCHNPHYSSPITIKVDGDTVNETVYRLLSAVSKEDGLIKRRGNEFCWACHGVNSDLPNPFGQDHKTAFINSKHNTVAPTSEETQIICLNCHAPHGSKDYPLIITANSANFCITCHQDNGFTETKLYDDSDTFTGLYLDNLSNKYLGTIHEQNFYGRNTCTMCHEPHGHITNRYMLRDPYNDHYNNSGNGNNVNGYPYGPVDWSADWNTESKTICFRCHDSQYYVGINGAGSSTVGSNFGNGNGKNYHDHSTKLKVSCRACHDPHSGQSRFQNSSPGWQLDNAHYINFDWAYRTGIAAESVYENTLAFIPAYGVNLEETGYSCAVTCHNLDHHISGGTFKSYIRTGNSPALKCAACHDFDTFDRNSRHPVLENGDESNVMVTCEQCHIEDHTKHDESNPYGLRATLTSNWAYTPDSTTLGTVIDPDTGEEVPAYGEFCWHCHGAGPDNRTILSDQYTKFINKPHSLLERDGSKNPYGPGIDNPCMKCHEHHSSTNVRLIRTVLDGVAIDAASDTGKINACMACHDGSPGDVDISAKYNAASHGGHYIKSDPTKKLLCTECHDPHGSVNVSYLLDTSNKYNTGITFPTDILVKGQSRDFCLACHPTSEEPERVYNTVYTIKVNESVNYKVYIQPLPYPDRIADHKSAGARECVVCHDAHKPWPPTGGEDRCYDCHSSDGEAYDIRALAGLDSETEGYYPGLNSHHRITDASTTSNTCVERCHTPHPHSPRADLIKTDHLIGDEKSMCLKCHSTVAEETYKSPYTIDAAQYALGPHDYVIPIRIFSDNSTFKGNCDKCHVPHGSTFAPLLKLRKDELCVDCHNGVTRDGSGNIIRDIKTQYEAQGHKYTEYPTAKMYCDECHVPHGSTNDNYLRDADTYAPTQTVTLVSDGVYQQQQFPEGISGVDYSPRKFCIVCHIEYREGVTSYVYYSSETSPGSYVAIPGIRKVLDHVTINEHVYGDTTECTICHNAHDPEPVGSDYDCFNCHGKDGYATRIEPLTGYGGYGGGYEWPTVAKATYHPIYDANSKGTNDCMVMCHKPHMHDPRANMLLDKRATAGDTTAPAAPASLDVNASSAVQADLSWPASESPDVFGYFVYRKIGAAGTWQKYGAVNNTVYNDEGQTSVTVWFYDGGLKPGTTYYYKVSAKDRNENESGQTAEVSVTPSLASDSTSPATPANLKATVPTTAGSTRLSLSWSAATDNYRVVQYYVYRGDAEDFIPSASNLVAKTGLTSVTDSGLTPETGYYYRVSAVDENGNVSSAAAPVYAKTDSADKYAARGLYSEDGDILEIRDIDGNYTTDFALGSNIIVKVKSDDGLDNAQTKRIYFKDHLNNIIATYETAMYSTDGIYEVFTFNIQLPTQTADGMSLYSGAYMLQADVYTKTAVHLTPYQVIRYGATAKGFRFYKDSARTQEAFSFPPNTTVYAKVFTDYPGGTTYVSPSLTTWKFNGSQLSYTNNLTWESPAYEYGFARFRFTTPSIASGAQEGWWYMFRLYAESSAKRNPTVADYGAMLMVKSNDTTPPEAPSSGPALTPGKTDMKLAWGASANSAGDLGAYSIYRSEDGTNYHLIGSTASTGFMDYGLKPGITYYYRVASVDLHGNISAPVSASAATQAYSILSDTVPPNRPEKLTLGTPERSQVLLTWTHGSAETDGVVGYAVYRSRNNVEYLRVGNSFDLSLTDMGLRGNTLYYYKVGAYDQTGNLSDLTAPVSTITGRTGDDSVEGTLCLSCHEEGRTPPDGYTVDHRISSAYRKSKHNVDFPVYTMKDGSQFESNCTKCHVPHGSDYPYLLRAPDNNELCAICHTDPSGGGRYSGITEFNKTAHGQPATGFSYEFQSDTPRYWVSERVYADAGRCYNCHDPHGRFVPGTENTTQEYIKSSAVAGTGDNLNELCYGCHGDSYTYNEYGGETVYKETYHGKTDTNPETGLPYNDKMWLSDYGNGECINCHEPHKDAEGAMLRYPVNVTDADKNKLCLTCHDREDILVDTGLFDGSGVYNNSKHALNAQWLEDFNTVGGQVYNKTTWNKGVCLVCHNSHGRTTDGSTSADKVIPKMLVVNDGPNSEICNKCHEYPSIADITVGYPGFSTFSQGVHKSKAQWPGGRYYPEPASAEVKGKCINCHDPHGTAVIDAWGNVTNIVGNVFDWEEKVCYECHDGITAASNLKFWEEQGIGHLPGASYLVHSFDEDIKTAERHVECLDCHNVHAVQDFDATEDLTTRLSKAFKGVSGVKVTGSPSVNTPDPTSQTWKDNPYAVSGYSYLFLENVDTEPAELREYMVCFKCHSSYSGATTGGKRIIAYLNPNNVSTHGFSFTEKTSFINTKINSIPDKLFPNDTSKPGYAFHPSNPNQRFNLTCSDCHGNPDTTGGKPRGPHGSNWEYILKGNPRSSSFCNECHPATQYGSDSAAATLSDSDPGGAYHRKSNHYGDLQSKIDTNAAEAFMSTFGTNVCRYCHFAGYMQNSTKYVSVHGENAAFSTASNGSYRAEKGLNGYFIKTVDVVGGQGQRSCDTMAVTGISSYSCSHGSKSY